MGEKASVFYLISFIKKNLRFIIIGGLIGMVLGGIVAFFIPAEYRSQVYFISEKKSMGLPSLSGIPGLGGLNLNSQTDNISPDLYFNIIQSPGFIRRMNQVNFSSEEHGEIRLVNFIIKHEDKSLVSLLARIPRMTRNKIFGSSSEVDKEKFLDLDRDGEGEIVRLSQEERVLSKYVIENVEITLDKGTGLINLTVFNQDRLLSAELAKFIFEKLKGELKNIQVEKAKRKYNFITDQYEESLERYNDIQLKLASFRDRNRDVSTAIARTQEERLSMDFNIASNVLNTLAIKKEEAKISYEEGIPVFTIINPITLPHNSIKRPPPLLLVVAFSFLGMTITFSFFFYRTHLKDYFVKS